MKKNILYLLALMLTVFASCDPLEGTYDEVKPEGYKKDLNLTLTTAYTSVDAAKTGIAATLNTTYPQLGNGSTASVTYNSTAPLPAQIKPLDSALSTLGDKPTQYTITDADYAATNGNAFKNFSATNVLKFLGTKFPTPVEKQIIVLNYVYFESGVTTSAGAPVVETFLYLNGSWNKVYHVSQAQYISAGKMTVFNFAAADEPNLNGYFNTFLKNDASVAAKAKAGDVKYVSFAYFASSKNYQRIRTLVFDGTNWGYKTVPATTTLGFLKKNGTWIADPTVYYTLSTQDYIDIADKAPASIGNTANRANLKSFKNFNIAPGQATIWTDADVTASIIYLLGVKYPNAEVDPTVFYNITYVVYRPPTGTDTKRFVKTAAGFEFVP